MQKNTQPLVIGFMLLGLLLFFAASRYLFHWITLDLQDGAWSCELAAQVAASSGNPLTAIEGRLLWSASLILMLLSMGLLLAASTYSVMRRLPRWAASAIPLLLLAGVTLAVITTPADHQVFMGRLADKACGFDEQLPFHFSRYLMPLFAPYYRASTLDLLSYAGGLSANLLPICNLLLLAGLLSTVWLRNPAHVTPDGLAQRIARFRLLLLLGSGLFTAIALNSMSEYSWFAQVAANGNEAAGAQLRGLQRGLTLYLGTVNSLALALFFLPVGWLLRQQADALAGQASAEETRDNWLERHHLRIFSGPLMKIGSLVAPLLASGGLLLLQQGLS